MTRMVYPRSFQRSVSVQRDVRETLSTCVGKSVYSTKAFNEMPSMSRDPTHLVMENLQLGTDELNIHLVKSKIFSGGEETLQETMAVQGRCSWAVSIS